LSLYTKRGKTKTTKKEIVCSSICISSVICDGIAARKEWREEGGEGGGSEQKRAPTTEHSRYNRHKQQE